MEETSKRRSNSMASVSSSTDFINPSHKPIVGQPAWDVALLYPLQGQWTEEEYLLLTDSSNRLIEYTEGRIEFLQMPTIEHQLVLRFLFRSLDGFVDYRKLGMVLFAPIRVYVEPERYREPDIVFNSTENHAKSGKRYYQSADLVMEVVSEDAESRERDLETKVADYAQSGIPEYWIVDLLEKRITVLTLDGDKYVEHGVFGEGQKATSKLLAGFVVDVTAVFAAAKV
jgi:Uma2 family endonuclease